MPKFQRYPGENPIAAKRRIMKNKLQSVRPGSINSRTMNRPTMGNLMRGPKKRGY